MYRKIATLLALCIIFSSSFAQRKTIDQRVDSLLRLMTLAEKIGQMNQLSNDFVATGPITKDGDKQDKVRKGMVGSYLNVYGAERTRSLQEIAMQSRLKIPLLFGQDVIHGFRTIFPLPLAEAASWDLPAMEKSARIAAIEAAAQGIHWTFAPMVDIGRDPRWGRVMEGAGEDPYLGSLIAAARVKGFQGKGLGNVEAVMACVKHFAAYGAAVGGRDYNSVDMSLSHLNQFFMPPYKAAALAGAATFMNSFNDLNGIPATASKYLQRDLLKGQWGFKGFVVSDWGSIGEMINHGYAKDSYDAAMLAAKAGSDMDMESRSYIDNLDQLVKDKKLEVAVIDDAVRRILRKKFEMGLFDDPYRFSDVNREKQQWSNAEHVRFAREIAAKSIVLLKNERKVLPLPKQGNTIAFVGPFVKAVSDHNGFWSFDWPDDSSRITTIFDAAAKKGTNKLLYAKGCGITDSSKAGFEEAMAVAAQSDIIVFTAGEKRDMSGEAKSRSNIGFPGVQEELIKALIATGKPVVVLVAAGRPLVFNYTADNATAIMYTWWLGTEAGNAIADVLFGDYNPSGKIPMTFPRTEGQIPVYYNHFNTGRPAKNETDMNYVSAYIDLPNSPKYPFGYGLSYTSFEYGEINLSAKTMTAQQPLKVSIAVKNVGDREGAEVVQLYVRDMVGSVVRPVKELKGFQKINLKAGETRTVNFTLTQNDLKFFNNEAKFITEPGDFKIFIGGNSQQVKEADFTLK
ncbi:MAG: beta-glucosidase BglX [Chitinophagaceae bacterium]|nr:MAG: beta-glucosidase BglX [Chitinophagaceae bacterium]